MGQQDDKTKKKEGSNQSVDAAPSQNTDDNKDVFTSAEYDFELLAKDLQQKPESVERAFTEQQDDPQASAASAGNAPWEEAYQERLKVMRQIQHHRRNQNWLNLNTTAQPLQMMMPRTNLKVD